MGKKSGSTECENTRRTKTRKKKWKLQNRPPTENKERIDGEANSTIMNNCGKKITHEKGVLTLGVQVGRLWSRKWLYLPLSPSFNPWSPGGSFIVQKMAISSHIPVSYELNEGGLEENKQENNIEKENNNKRELEENKKMNEKENNNNDERKSFKRR